MGGEPTPTMARELWALHLSGEEITAQEEAMLREILLKNEGTRRELLADHQTHRCLQALSIPVNEDEFVSGVMNRIVEAQNSAPDSVPPQAPPVARVTAPERDAEQVPIKEPRRNYPLRRRTKSVWLRAWSVEPVVAVAALVAFLALGAMAGFVFRSRSQVVGGSRANRTVTRPYRLSKPKAIPSVVDNGVGTLVSSELGSWERPRAGGSRLQPGLFRLDRGEAEIELDSGALVRLIGPAELKIDSANQLQVERGTLAAVVPSSAGELRLETPTSKLIGQTATMDLVVDLNGGSDVFVREGAVSVEPWANLAGGKPLVLTSADVNRVTVWPASDTDPRSPLAIASQSDGGKFSGRISVNGSEMGFHSREAFETVRQRVETQFRDSVDQLERDWASAVRLYGGGKATGAVSLNGVRMGFQNLDDVIELQRKLAETTAFQSAASGGNANGARAFQGMININGEVREFSSAEEFEKAQKDVFGPLQALGIGGFSAGNLKDVLNSAPQNQWPPDNPFLPRNNQPADNFGSPAKGNLPL